MYNKVYQSNNLSNTNNLSDPTTRPAFEGESSKVRVRPTLTIAYLHTF